jgi:hypothetical protein
MGSGASPKFEKNLNTEKMVNVFAYDGNIRDALDKIENLIYELAEDPDNSTLWESLRQERDRFVNRSKGYVYDVTGLILDQNRTK